MDSILMEYDYNRYLDEVMIEQADLEQHVNKILSLNESYDRNAELQAFIEAAEEKTKNIWQRFIAWIKKTFAKFTERLTNALSGTHRMYLDKYKDIILKKRVQPGSTVTMPDHSIGIQRIFDSGYTVDAISTADAEAYIKNCLNNTLNGKDAQARIDDDEAARIKAIELGYNSIGPWKKIRAIYDNENVKITNETTQQEKRARIKTFFLGGASREVPTNDPSLNMSDMFEFCYNASKQAELVKKDTEGFEASCNTIIASIDKQLKANTNLASTAANKPAQSPETGGNKALDIINRQAQGQVESAIFTEAEEKDNGTASIKNTAATSNTANTANTTPDGQTTNAKSGTFNINNNRNDDNKGAERAANLINQHTSDVKSVNKSINLINRALYEYRDEAVNVLTGKMNAIVQISKNYMALIRNHVQSYIGEKDNVADTTVTQNKTTYNEPEKPEQQQPAQK